MSDTQNDGTEQIDVLDEIDGMDHYGVTLLVSDSDIGEGSINVELRKSRSTRHVDSTRLYYGEPHYGGEEKWRCILNDNYAVVDKALELLNDRPLDAGTEQ